MPACLPSVHVPPEQSAPTKLDNIARRTTMKTRTEAEQPTTPLPYQASHFSVQPASQPAGSSVLYIEFASHRATVESLVVVVIGRVIIINIVGPRAGWRHSEQQQQQYHQATTTNDDQPCINSYRSSHCLCWRWLVCLPGWLTERPTDRPGCDGMGVGTAATTRRHTDEWDNNRKTLATTSFHHYFIYI